MSHSIEFLHQDNKLKLVLASFPDFLNLLSQKDKLYIQKNVS